MEPGGARDPEPSGAARRPDLAAMLRLLVIADRQLAQPRALEGIVEAALRGGARAIQIRAKGRAARETLAAAHRLRKLTRSAGALLFINDRLDLALAVSADGVHLGPDDLPVEEVRKAAPPPFLIGYSTDEVEVARAAETQGADYIGCGAVWVTLTKEVAGEVIGLGRLDEVAAAVRIPVVAIGGVTPARAAEVALTRAAGVAVAGAVITAADPAAAARALLEPFEKRAGRAPP